MYAPKKIAVVSLTTLVLVSGCASSGDSSSPRTTQPSTTATTQPATTTTKAPAALTAALLTSADVPGSTASPAEPDSAGSEDLSVCFPGNPLGVKTDPGEVKGPDLSVSAAGGVETQFSSNARQASPEQAKAFVETFASPSGSACVLNAYKSAFAADTKPPKIDASGLSGTATTAAVGDGGAVLALAGNLVLEGNTIPAGADVVIFRKGTVVVLLLALAFGGPTVPGQGVGLANKIAGRLS